MSTRAESMRLPKSPALSPSPWIYGPWLDLVVGCGAWSAPLLAVAMWLTPGNTHGWATAFYFLALVFNYPHFMATVYRAYHTRADFEKYKFFTLHLTLLLALTGAVVHIVPALLPWLFTLYICWSPWHYTGQNYGLMMMFARRGGATVASSDRRWLRAAFIVSYLMLLASFETGGSADPLILSVGITAKFTLPARLVLGGAFAIFTLLGFDRLVRERGWKAMAAPITLAVTQFLWFVLPTLVELRAAYQIPQTRYSSGILALMHSAQYLWITSYYQRCEAKAAGQSGWRMAGYFLTLVAGGIALFIPGPWLVSKVFHFDFTSSFLIFTAIVNIHHFMLDGALWKLRDTRVSSLLIDKGTKSALSPGKKPAAKAAKPPEIPSPSPAPAEFASAPVSAPGWSSRLWRSAPLRASLAGLLFLWGGWDQVHFALGTSDGNLPALLRAARMDSYDAALQARVAAAEEREGNRAGALAALAQAVALNPHSESLQQAYARALIESGRFDSAYDLYTAMLKKFPLDADALVNYGLLAARRGQGDIAVDSWQKAVDVDPNLANAHLYLAEALDQKGELAAAAGHWVAYLKFAADFPQDPAAAPRQIAAAQAQLADDEARLGKSTDAMMAYQAGIIGADQAADPKLESVARVHRADLEEKLGDPKGAASDYESALALDSKVGDRHAEAVDWFNYGQFLRRRNAQKELVYACLLHAENLLAGGDESALATIRGARLEVEKQMGRASASAVQNNLESYLARATSLP
ncbi:MAG TPA: tetratricopeptide repeat protein [Verrucomicrobiae bacterium]|nr:tetratricopeptide repeat protein [Verrucomicrobiae bacterium]